MRGRIAALAVLGLQGLFCLSAFSQTERSEYRLGPRDTIDIVVFGQAEYGAPGATVRPDGSVTHPFLGRIHVEGKTPTEVEAAVREELLSELRDPIVTVAVVALREREEHIYFLGAVNSAAPFRTEEPITVEKALALTAGFTPQANRTEAVIIPKAGPPQAILIGTPEDVAAAPLLNPGDTLLIQQREGGVWVSGEVARPGRVELPPEESSIVHAILGAGGLTPDANHEEALLVRVGGDPSPIHLASALVSEEPGRSVVLEPGDMLVFGRSVSSVLVLGAVVTPGRQRLGQDSVTVLDAVMDAGGLADEADRQHVTLTRRDGSTVDIDLAKALATAGAEANPQLVGGDIVTVGRTRVDILVLGAVRNPGSYRVVPGDGLYELLALAGGPSETADLSGVRITRGDDTVVQVSAKSLYTDFELALNIPVKPGDVVYVPHDTRQVMVFGAVANPGPHPLRDGDRVLDIIANLGSFGEDAKPVRTAVIRVEDGEAHVYLVNARKLMQGLELERNYELEDGDIIFVPRDTGFDFADLVGQIYQTALMIRVFK